MKSLPEILRILHEYKLQMSVKYGIKKLGIFGSVARGEQTERSDLDVFVEVQVADPYILGDIREDLEHLLECRIDLLRLRRGLNSLLLKNIEEDGILA